MVRRPTISWWTCWLALVGLGFATACLAAEFHPFDGPKPTAVFIQSNPWASVIGADTPRVAVYESGEVIFRKQIDGRGFYFHLTLDKQALDTLQEHVKPVLAIKDLKRSYNVAPNVTDQPEAIFYFRSGDREVTSTVYGLKADDTRLPAYTVLPGDAKPDVPPVELLKLHAWLCKLDYADSKPWLPKYIEVMFSEYSYAPDASIVWPKDWPGLDSERAIKRGDSYSIFVDGNMIQKVNEFLATRKERGAVEIGGKKMSASWRYTFPSEPVWRKALAQ
ncbi:MAG TPA: hypothetical protein VIK18_20555 [Pirellulales bacterium]